MSESRPNPVIRLMPSLTDLAFLLPVLFLFTRMNGVRGLLGDGDTGWHIRAGEWMLQNGRILDHDVFSYTRPGARWYAWEWLWDVAFAWLYRHGGMAAVVLASLLVLSATFALLFRVTRRKCGNVLAAMAMVFLAALLSTIHWLARPHLFTLLFAVVFYSILERAREGRTKLLAWLLPLTVLWTNVHGGFVIGLAMIGCYAAGGVLEGLLETDRARRRAALAGSKPYLLAMLGCGILTLANPFLYQLHIHIYRYLTDSYQFKNIVEFQGADFHHPMAGFLEVMALLAAVSAYRNLMRKQFTQALLLVGMLHGALISQRNIPLLAILAAPAVAATLTEALGELAASRLAAPVRNAAKALVEMAAEFGEMDRLWRVHAVSAATVLALAAMCYAPAPPENFRADYDAKKYPTKAAETLRASRMATRIFADDEWGDYLIYRLYPEKRVFVDGRSDFYGSRFDEKYVDIVGVKPGWEERLRDYGVNAILLPIDTPLTGALRENRRWRPVYDDGVAIVFFPAEGNRSAAGPAAGGERESVAGNGSRERAREFTELNTRDPRSTKSNTRSEQL